MQRVAPRESCGNSRSTAKTAMRSAAAAHIPLTSCRHKCAMRLACKRSRRRLGGIARPRVIPTDRYRTSAAPAVDIWGRRRPSRAVDILGTIDASAHARPRPHLRNPSRRRPRSRGSTLRARTRRSTGSSPRPIRTATTCASPPAAGVPSWQMPTAYRRVQIAQCLGLAHAWRPSRRRWEGHAEPAQQYRPSRMPRSTTPRQQNARDRSSGWEVHPI